MILESGSVKVALRLGFGHRLPTRRRSELGDGVLVLATVAGLCRTSCSALAVACSSSASLAARIRARRDSRRRRSSGSSSPRASRPNSASSALSIPSGLGQQLRDLLGEDLLPLTHPCVAHGLAPGGIRAQLRAVQRSPAKLDHPGGLTQRQRLQEQVPQRGQVPAPEPRDRPVVRGLAALDTLNVNAHTRSTCPADFDLRQWASLRVAHQTRK